MAEATGGQIIWNLDIDNSKFNRKIKESEQAAKGFANEVDKNVGSNISKAFTTAAESSRTFGISFLATATAIAGAIGFGAKIAGNLEAARQGFVALLGSAEEADKTIERVKLEAKRTPFELPGLVQGTQALAAITKNGDQAVDILLDVGKAIAISGKGQADLDLVVANLQQIAATGVVTELDIRQFQRAIPIFNDILKSAGLTTEELKSSANAGELLFKAFKSAGSEGGIAFAGFSAQTGTFNQLLSNTKDQIGITASEIVKQTGVFDIVKSGFQGIIDTLVNFQPKIIEGITAFLNFLRINAAAVGGAIFGALVPALIAVLINLSGIVLALVPFIILGAVLFATWDKNKPLFFAIASGLTAIGTAILISMIPALIAAVPPIVAMAIAFLPILALGVLVGGVVFLIVKHFDSLKAAFYGVSRTVTEVYNSVAGTFTAMYRTVAGLVGSITNALRSSFSGIGSAIFQSLSSALSTVFNFVGRFVAAGADIGRGMLQGITNAKDAIINKIKEICSGALDTVKKFFGIKSPSRIMALQGKYIMQGLERGITSNVSGVTAAAQDASQNILGSFGGEAGVGTMALAPNVSTGNMSSPSQSGQKVVVNPNFSGIVARSRSEWRDIMKDGIDAINEELRARGITEIGVGNITATNG